MTQLTWDDTVDRVYEAGVDRGVLYPTIGDGVAWSGLTAVSMHPSGGAAQAYYIDGRKYIQVAAAEEFAATLEAYTYPREFADCDGTGTVHNGLFATQQDRQQFGLSYRTKIGSASNPDYAYKIHIIYNALAEPSDTDYKSIGDSPDTVEFSWNITTTPPFPMTGIKPTSHLEIDTRYANPNAILDVEAILYGNTENEPRLPDLDELIAIFDAYAILSVTDNGDGTALIEGPDEAIVEVDPSTFTITWPSVEAIDVDTYLISSL